MDDTDADRAAIQPLLNQVMMYPLSQYTGSLQTFDWTTAPDFPAGDTTSGEQETQWVLPEQFFTELPAVLDEVPARPGEEALYAWIRSLLDAAATNDHTADQLTAAAVNANNGLVADLFQFRNLGIPTGHHWSTQHNGAAFGTDYLSRTAMGKANIFVNTPNETAYFYQDFDSAGHRLSRPPRLHAHTPRRPATPGTRLLVAHPLQPTSLLPPQPDQPLLARHQKQKPSPELGRLAHPDRVRLPTRRPDHAIELATRTRRRLLPVPARLLAQRSHPRRQLDATTRAPNQVIIRVDRFALGSLPDVDVVAPVLPQLIAVGRSPRDRGNERRGKGQ